MTMKITNPHDPAVVEECRQGTSPTDVTDQKRRPKCHEHYPNNLYHPHPGIDIRSIDHRDSSTVG